MYILVLARSYPSKEYPLQGIFELDQARALAKRGHKVVMLALDLRSFRRWRKFGLTIFEEDNIKVYLYNFPLGAVPSFLLAFFSKLFSQFLMKKIIKKDGKPDIIHAHFCLYQGYYGAFLSKEYNIPMVITEHSSGLMINYDEKKSKYYKIGYEEAKGIISVSNALRDALKKYFGYDSIVIPNIVELKHFAYVEKKEHDTFTFVTVGNLIYSKGMDTLLKAFAKLNKSNIKLIIIGDGIERKNLKELAINLEIEQQVQFCGALQRDVIAKYINNSDCFVLASRSETFGVVYIESLATGTPIIATRCGGPNDIVSDSNGLLVDVDDISELTDAMRFMMENADKYDHYKIAVSTSELYSADTIALRLSDYFSTIRENFSDSEVSTKNDNIYNCILT